MSLSRSDYLFKLFGLFLVVYSQLGNDSFPTWEHFIPKEGTNARCYFLEKTKCNDFRVHLKKDNLISTRGKRFTHVYFYMNVILACSYYIHNTEGDWQINNTFGVTFDEPDGKRIIGGMKYYIHHSKDRKRLVIHTRQLSQYSNELLRSMANTIRKHFKEIGESYEAICY